MHIELSSVPMPESDLQTRLHALARDAKSRSKTARLKDVFEHVEAALDAGVSRSDVLAELNRDGFDMTLASFKSALQRIRTSKAGRPQLAESKTAELGKSSEKEANKNNGEQSALYRQSKTVELPEDWMSAALTPAQNRMLTPAQRRARTDTISAQFFPNRFKPEGTKT